MTYVTIQIPVKCFSHIPNRKGFFCLLMETSSWSYLVLKTVGKTGDLSLSDFAMTFLSQYIIFWYCNMKNIWLVCKKLTIFYQFLLFFNYFCEVHLHFWKRHFGFTFLRMAHLSDWYYLQQYICQFSALYDYLLIQF